MSIPKNCQETRFQVWNQNHFVGSCVVSSLSLCGLWIIRYLSHVSTWSMQCKYWQKGQEKQNKWTWCKNTVSLLHPVVIFWTVSINFLFTWTLWIRIFTCQFMEARCNLISLLFSSLYNVSTSSYVHLTIMVSSSSSCLCHSSLLPSIPFLPSAL